jgi:hypothetical protein
LSTIGHDIVLVVHGGEQEAFKLLFVTEPAVKEMDESSRRLREQIASLKETIARQEAHIGKHNPALFHTLQVLPQTPKAGVRITGPA